MTSKFKSSFFLFAKTFDAASGAETPNFIFKNIILLQICSELCVILWSSLQSHEHHDGQTSDWPPILTWIHMRKSFRIISVTGRIVQICEVDSCLRSLFLESVFACVAGRWHFLKHRLGSILERFARNTVLMGLCVCFCTHCWHTGTADSRWDLAGSRTGSRAQRESSFPAVGRAVGLPSHMTALEEKVR